MNVITLIGNLGKDPEIKYFESGAIVCNLSISHEEYNSKTKEKTTHWIDCKAWGKTAENIAEYFKKGSKIAIEGKVLTESWQTEDGKTRKKLYVLVNRFDFLTKKEGSSNSNQSKNNSDEQIVKFAEDEFSEDLIGDEEIPF